MSRSACSVCAGVLILLLLATVVVSIRGQDGLAFAVSGANDEYSREEDRDRDPSRHGSAHRTRPPQCAGQRDPAWANQVGDDRGDAATDLGRTSRGGADGPAGEPARGTSIYWTALNKGKRSATIDLRSPAIHQHVPAAVVRKDTRSPSPARARRTITTAATSSRKTGRWSALAAAR